MLLKTILNKCHKFKSFVFKNVKFIKHHGIDAIEIEIQARKNGSAICSKCHKQGLGYDKLNYRYFEHIPIWGFKVFFKYLMRRVDCNTCGVTVKEVPWAKVKKELSNATASHATWARDNIRGRI